MVDTTKVFIPEFIKLKRVFIEIHLAQIWSTTCVFVCVCLKVQNFENIAFFKHDLKISQIFADLILFQIKELHLFK